MNLTKLYLPLERTASSTAVVSVFPSSLGASSPAAEIGACYES